MRCKRAFAACLMMLAPPLSWSAEPITAGNWEIHPAIREIRAIYLETKRAEAAGRLSKGQRTFEYCRAYEDGERTLYLSRTGAVRSYRVGRGSEDSAVQATSYYDGSGALRFVFATAAAVNGTVVEYRIYLSGAGKRMWEDRRDLKGPGYGFPAQLPDDWLVEKPRQAYLAKDPRTVEN
jgi:hypothetical protein